MELSIMAVNIVIADDHKMVREGLKCLLELDKAYNVVGEAGDGYECLDVVSKTNPDIIIMDINMPNLDGLQTLKIMRQENINKKAAGCTFCRKKVAGGLRPPPPTGMVSVFSRAAGTSYNKGVAAEAAGADSGNANGRNPRRRFLPSQACRRAAISPSP